LTFLRSFFSWNLSWRIAAGFTAETRQAFVSRVRDGSTGVGSFRYVSFTFVRLEKRLLAALPHLATLALQAAGALLLPLSTHRGGW
jgi:hypothetical protein